MSKLKLKNIIYPLVLVLVLVLSFFYYKNIKSSEYQIKSSEKENTTLLEEIKAVNISPSKESTSSAIKGQEDPAQTAKEELYRIKALVGRHIALPDDEEPTLATVSNLERLRGQEFFKRAELGDKVLLYVPSGKAILYSVRKDQILEVSSFSTGK